MPHTTQPPKARRLITSTLALALFVSMTSMGYDVQPGDTLAQIAADHGTTTAELAAANDITDPDLIVIGQTLTIPGPDSADHTVAPGETLGQIAALYGTTVADLIAANELSNPNLLGVGQLISIPGEPTVASEAEPSIIGAHIVAAGDTLASIAIRYGTTVEAIVQANGITDPSQIFVGTRLTIADGVATSSAGSSEPTGTSVHTVAAGETLAVIASRFGTTVQSLVATNSLENPDVIRPGEQLTVPSTGWICPVSSGRYFNDWGFPRSGGRFHQGNDLFAPRGTEAYAPVSGSVELKSGVVGGLQFWLTGDDGRTYIGTHLDGFALAGDVPAGAVIGYVGDSGNAVGSDPHLHFEILVDGSPINPYPILREAGC